MEIVCIVDLLEWHNINMSRKSRYVTKLNLIKSEVDDQWCIFQCWRSLNISTLPHLWRYDHRCSKTGIADILSRNRKKRGKVLEDDENNRNSCIKEDYFIKLN